MGTISGLTKERMLEIEAACIVSGAVVLNDLILTRHDGSQFNAGVVKGPQGAQGGQGVQGTQGTQGTQGPNGAIGSQGSQGVQGTQGISGLGQTGLVRAYRSSNVNPASGVAIVFDAETIDASNWFNTANGRYTPQVAGWYLVGANVESNAAGTNTAYWQITLMKNGGQVSDVYCPMGNGASVSISDFVLMNGSTDYIEVYRSSNASDITIRGGSERTNFHAKLIAT